MRNGSRRTGTNSFLLPNSLAKWKYDLFLVPLWTKWNWPGECSQHSDVADAMGNKSPSFLGHSNYCPPPRKLSSRAFRLLKYSVPPSGSHTSRWWQLNQLQDLSATNLSVSTYGSHWNDHCIPLCYYTFMFKEHLYWVLDDKNYEISLKNTDYSSTCNGSL